MPTIILAAQIPLEFVAESPPSSTQLLLFLFELRAMVPIGKAAADEA